MARLEKLIKKQVKNEALTSVFCCGAKKNVISRVNLERNGLVVERNRVHFRRTRKNPHITYFWPQVVSVN